VKAGVIIYIAFLSNDVWSDEKTGEELLKRSVDTIWQLPTQWSAAQNKKISLKEAGADVLIVPQASLAAKLKQKTLQYHGLIEKTKGGELYKMFVDLWTQTVENNNQSLGLSGSVKFGTYGNRQGLKVISNGPNTLHFEF